MGEEKENDAIDGKTGLYGRTETTLKYKADECITSQAGKRIREENLAKGDQTKYLCTYITR